MGKMSEIDYEIRSASGLVGELRSYPQHYTAAHEAADRIEALQEALQSLLDVQNGPPLIKYADEWGSAVEAARAALEGKDG